MNNSNFVRLRGWLALLTGSAGILALITLILFFAGVFLNIQSFFPLGHLTDILNGVVGIVSAGLASTLVQMLQKSQPRLSLILLIGVWLGAIAIAYGSWLILTNQVGVERATYFNFFGNGLIGVWLWSLNRRARQQTIWPRGLTRMGSLAGIFMMAGLLSLYGILMGLDGNNFSPLVMISSLGYLGIGILYPLWCLRLGRLILSQIKDSDGQ